MKVSELIERLRQLPGDLPVLVEGYESGWDDIHEVRTAGMARYRSAQEWDGEYQTSDVESNQAGKPVVLLVGRRGMRR